ncbi:MAG: lysylphosphatidylglycerol synthase transmembrane domain-containing protein [Terrisporobacter sp.]|uniref:lysylphosphatidylglycerol synthase transmembrane domain-containing protein n=1 Tax=Terrisporobacter sp. TaxID=1965305 RepID=UPI002FCAF7C1
MDKKNNKALWRYVFLIALMVVTINLVIKNLDISMLSSVVTMVSKKYLAVGALAIIFYIILEGIILQIIINEEEKTKNRFLGYKLAIMGFYYNLVTPFASGSQPVQIYVLNKHNVSLSKATGIITNKTILYQVVTTVYCAAFILLNIGTLKYQMKGIIPLVILGLGANIFTFVVGFLAIVNTYKVKEISHRTVNFLIKFKLFKSLSDKHHKIDKFIEEYTDSVKFFLKNKKLLVTTVILTVVQISAYFSIAFWIYKAFNLDGHGFIYLLTLQVYLYMAISPIPTPGNIGANEIAFFTIFKSVFPQTLLGYAVFLYGGFMYYLILIFSGIATIYLHYKMDKRNKYSKNLESTL